MLVFVLSACARLLVAVGVLYFSGILLAVWMCLAPVIDPSPLGAAAEALLLLLALLGFALRSRRTRMLLVTAAVLMAVLHGNARSARVAHMPAAVSERLAARPRAVLVTGSTRGIGLQVARRFAHLGWTVFVHGRSAEAMAETAARINAEFAGKAIAVGVGGDLASFRKTRAFCAQVRDHVKSKDLELLVNNAALARIVPAQLTEDGFDTLMQTNCIAGALIEQELRQSCPLRRVVHVTSLSSAAASTDATVAADLKLSLENEFGDAAYGRTKLCQIAFAMRPQSDAAPIAVSVHPGGCRTDMPEDSLSAAFPPPLVPGGWWRRAMRPLTFWVLSRLWFDTAWCAENVVFAAGAEPVRNGAYFGRFHEMPHLLHSPLQHDAAYTERIQSNIERAIAPAKA